MKCCQGTACERVCQFFLLAFEYARLATYVIDAQSIVVQVCDENFREMLGTSAIIARELGHRLCFIGFFNRNS
jgi:hypothetical protein